MELTELEKTIYNKHLIVSRRIKNKPFKLKKDFSKIQNTESLKFLKRLSTLFIKHPEINMELFFEAPYVLYPDVEYFGLDYFSSMRAIKSYTLYKKQKFLQDPDSQLEEVINSIKFITHFCIDKKIYLHQYPYHRTTDLFTWMEHYKQNSINIYVMMEFPNILDAAKSLAQDLQHFFVSNFIENFTLLYQNYTKSTQVKSFLKKSIPVVSKFIEQQLTLNKPTISSK